MTPRHIRERNKRSEWLCRSDLSFLLCRDSRLGRLGVIGHHQKDGVAPLLQNGVFQLGNFGGAVILFGLDLGGQPVLQIAVGGRHIAAVVLLSDDQNGADLTCASGGVVDHGIFDQGSRVAPEVKTKKHVGDLVVQELQLLGKSAGIQDGLSQIPGRQAKGLVRNRIAVLCGDDGGERDRAVVTG